MAKRNPIDETAEAAAMIARYLQGRQPEIIAAILADLTSTWLAGCFDKNGRTAELREAMLADHIDCIRDLIPVQEMLLLKRLKATAN